MKRISIYIILLASVFFSCGKQPLDDNDEKKLSSETCRINYADVSYNGGTVQSCTIGYDNDKNISAINSTQDTAFTSFSVIKSASLITLKTKYHGNWTYQLDEKNRVVSAHEYYDFTFTYNAEGYLSTARVVEDPTHIATYSFSYSNGNLTKITGENSGYNTSIVIDFTYDLNMPMFTSIQQTEPISYIELYGILPGYFGKVNKNQLVGVRKVSMHKLYGFGGSENFSFTYFKNDKEKVSKIQLDRIYGSISNLNVETFGFKDALVYNFKYVCD